MRQQKRRTAFSFICMKVWPNNWVKQHQCTSFVYPNTMWRTKPFHLKLQAWKRWFQSLSPTITYICTTTSVWKKKPWSNVQPPNNGLTALVYCNLNVSKCVSNMVEPPAFQNCCVDVITNQQTWNAQSMCSSR